MRGVQVGIDKHHQFEFDIDVIRLQKNRSLYKNIKPRYENCAFEVRVKGKYVGRRHRLIDAVLLRDSFAG